MHGAVERWWSSRAESFASGAAHEENLAYLLGDDFAPTASREQLVQSFVSIAGLAPAADDVTLVRGIYFLADAPTSYTPLPSLNRVDEERDARPPSLVLLGDPDDSAWKTSFETHVAPVPAPSGMPPGVAVRYEHSRTLGAPDDAPYQRSITLELDMA